MNRINLDDETFISIVGETNTGKSTLAYNLLKEYKGKKKKFVFGVKENKQGYPILNNINDLFNIKDSVIYIDELSLVFPHYEKRANEMLRELLQLIRHRNLCFIVATCDKGYFKKGIEQYISSYIVTRINNLKDLTNGSKIKQFLKDTKMLSVVSSVSVLLDLGEALFLNDFNAFPFVFKNLELKKEHNLKGVGKK